MARYPGGSAWHLGVDENGPGGGNTDYDDPIQSVCDGIVEYVYSGNGGNMGWGRIIVIKQMKQEDGTHSDLLELAKESKVKAGKNINRSEAGEMLAEYRHQKDTVDELKGEIEKLTTNENTKLKYLTETNRKQKEMIDGYCKELNKYKDNSEFLKKELNAKIEYHLKKLPLTDLINEIMRRAKERMKRRVV